MWYWAALKPFESAFQMTDSDCSGYINDLKTIKGVKKRLSKIKWADKMEETPCRIEVYMCYNPNDLMTYQKVMEWAI